MGKKKLNLEVMKYFPKKNESKRCLKRERWDEESVAIGHEMPCQDCGRKGSTLMNIRGFLIVSETADPERPHDFWVEGEVATTTVVTPKISKIIPKNQHHKSSQKSSKTLPQNMSLALGILGAENNVTWF